MSTKLSDTLGKIALPIALTLGLNLGLASPALSYDQLTPHSSSKSSNEETLVTQEDTLVPALVLLEHSNLSELSQIQNHIQVKGGQVIHTMPYQALIANIAVSSIQDLPGLPGVAAVYTQPVDLATLDHLDPAARHFAGVWNSLLTPQPVAQLNSMQAEHPETYEDAFVAPDLPPDSQINAAGAILSTPGYFQTSDYLAGSVAVGIILVESDGSIDRSSENWTPAEQQLVFNEIAAGLNWWANLEPRAKLSFVYDDHFSQPLSTRVEPITRPQSDQQYWISDVMKELGYTASSYFTQVRDYNNALRTFYHTDWAFTIFVVDSSADSDHRFSSGHFAYAYLGGPFMVMTSGNNGYGPDNMDAVTAHEVGHIFHALDQYGGAGQACTRRSGYLAVENLNSEYGGCPSNVNSIMRGQIYPYTLRAIDPYAAGQVGWRDSDSDNILDPLDVTLTLTANDLVPDNNRITVTGQAEIIPYPSPSRLSVTISQIKGVQYRLDDGAWQQASANDGAFDSPTESYSLTFSPLLPGLHTLKVAAVDSFSNALSPVVSRAFVMPDPIAGSPHTKLYTPDKNLAGQALVVSGAAYHTQLGDYITKVEYRLNGGPWQMAQAQDGSFDSSYEPFILTIASPSTGPLLIEAFASDANGHTEANWAKEEIQVPQAQPFKVLLPIISSQM
jgi:hypothetical protein